MSEFPEATQQSLLGGKRELKSVVVGGQTYHYYHPINLAEQAEGAKHVKYDALGQLTIDREGIADSLIARLRKSDGSKLLFKHHRNTLLDQPADLLNDIFNAIGGFGLGGVKESIEAAEKK